MKAVDWYCPGCAELSKHDKAVKGERRPGIATALLPTETVEAWAASRDIPEI